MDGESQEAAAGIKFRTTRVWERGPQPSQAQKNRGWRTRRDPFNGVWELVIEPLLRPDEDRVLEAPTILELLEHGTRASSVRDNSAHYNAASETGARFTAPTARRSSSKFIHPAAKPRSTFKCDRILAGSRVYPHMVVTVSQQVDPLPMYPPSTSTKNHNKYDHTANRFSMRHPAPASATNQADSTRLRNATVFPQASFAAPARYASGYVSFINACPAPA